MDDVLKKIYECMIDLDAKCVEENIKNALRKGYKALDLVMGPLSSSMEKIGELYEEGEYFIAELMEAAEIFKKAFKILEPLLAKESKNFIGFKKRLTIVIGTVKGDIHDIGKSIVSAMLQASGHRVIDLGVDVDADKFIDAIVKYDADVLGMSALLTSTAKYMKEVIDELKKRGLRDKVFVIIGGAATSEDFAKEIGADAWAKDAIEALKIINDYAEKQARRNIR